MATATQNIGKITQVIGSTFDVEFPEDQLPPIYNAVKIETEIKGISINLMGEIQQHLGGGRVRWGLPVFESRGVEGNYGGERD